MLVEEHFGKLELPVEEPLPERDVGRRGPPLPLEALRQS
jgi:hypothetical protein